MKRFVWLVFALSCCASANPTQSSNLQRLIGSWKASNGKGFQQIDFLKEGYFTFSQSSPTGKKDESGTFQILSGPRVKLDYGSQIAIYRMSLTGNSLTLSTPSGDRTVYSRIPGAGSGAVALTMKIDANQTPSPSDLSDTSNIIKARIAAVTGLQKSDISTKWNANEITIVIPGDVNQASVEATIGRRCQVTLYHARTIVTDRDRYRPYMLAGQSDTGIIFHRTQDTKPIHPGTAEYQQIVNSWGDGITDITLAPHPGDSSAFEFRLTPTELNAIEDWKQKYVRRDEHVAITIDGVVQAIVDEQNLKATDGFVFHINLPSKQLVGLRKILPLGTLPVQMSIVSAKNVHR